MSEQALSEGEREALIEAIQNGDQDAWVEAIIAARLAPIEALALNAAADALEGGLGVDGTPRDLYEFRQWLRARAALTAVRAGLPVVDGVES